MEEHLIPEDELIKTRIEKLQRMKSLGKDPFALEKYQRCASIKSTGGAQAHVEPYSADVISAYETNEPQEGQDATMTLDASLAGRVVSLRLMGKAAFIHIQDRKGKIQVYLKRDDLGDDYEMVKLLDLGDFIGVAGFVFRTRTGEVSVHAKSIAVLSKSIRPIPLGKEKGDQHWYGLQDVEQRYRQRHIDLITNAESRDVFIKRSKIVSAVREFYDNRGYLEVETPVLQSVAGGAAARPFLTYHNALEHDFHLRISLELYLKRLMVGGLEKVYEIGRVFRNEGMSTRHNPEFTMLESYEAYANLEDMMRLLEELFNHIANTLYNGPKIPHNGQIIDLTPPWPRLPILDGIEKYAGVKPGAFDSLESALAAMEKLGLPTEGEHMIGGIIEKIHERFVEPNLIQPTFVTDFPLETSPLAKKIPGNERFVRRFDLYIGTREIAPAYSELNDPIDQKERFTAQASLRAEGDEEAHPMDDDFVRALEYGMPPTGGLGIGIDRLVMLFTDQDAIRDVILFPQMKPEK
ncbi:MAG: lysine--tRNA ligase [Armatimonadota bacterium]|nr:lysine--tRNA ligase [bacterium]